ncbi:hypothetical protein C8Q75DRAFT_804386 [Abortiporus biennis]|nr:hypothetical protein C8Q75DRAFT_804386 [Abortiporus biennis]
MFICWSFLFFLLSFKFSFVLSAPIFYHNLVHSGIGRRESNELSKSDLLPITPLASWTTSPGMEGALPLDSSTLIPTNVEKDLPIRFTQAPDGQESLEAYYPKGTFRLVKNSAGKVGGVSFYTPGPESVDLTKAKEATLSYTTYFPKGFDWVKGGKLPGFYGGDDPKTAVSCSGGRHSETCFSVRYMWRAGGAGELYTYTPPSASKANEKLCTLTPESECNPEYGNSDGRGLFTFAEGARTLITMRVLLNDAGKENGELQMWVNGKSLINESGLVFRTSPNGRIRGIQIQSFFGGKSFHSAP